MTPANLSPLYYGQLLVHGMGFSFDRKTIDVVSIASNSVTFIDTATNAIKHITYVGRTPHEAFFTPDDSEVWVAVRGENYVQVIDGKTYENKDRIYVGDGPGMTIFSPDGKYGYVCSSNEWRCRPRFCNHDDAHHQGAIDMVKAELAYGKDPVMRRLAEEIVVDQQSEIQAVQLWLSKLTAQSSKKEK